MANGADRWFFKRAESEFDRRPGGPGESRQFGRTYDVRSETEFTNRPPSTSQIKEASIQEQIAAEQADLREAALAAQSRVHVFPSVGKFIIPDENTWAAHAVLVKDLDQNLYFNPEKYIYFDKIIADKLNLPALTDPKHKDYDKYEGLRTNIAILRNDIIGMYVHDGSFDPGDEVHIYDITSIAEALGDALSGDKWYKRPFVDTFSIDVANVEGIGAREMYNYLLSVQIKPAGMFEEMRNRINYAFGIPNRSWALPPLEETPFSPKNMAEPPPLAKQCFTPSELAQACANDDYMITLSGAMAATAGNLFSPDTLPPPVHKNAIEEARTILRWLRNLQFSDRDMEEWISHGSPPERAAKAEAVTRLAEIFGGLLARHAHQQPALMNNLAVEDARSAIGAMAQGMMLYSLSVLPANHPDAKPIAEVLDSMPKEWELRDQQSVAQLLDTLETGLGQVTGVAVGEKSAVDRLLEMSQNITQSAYKLRSVREMRPPAREESIELAREILRKLKNLSFSDRPIEELVVQGHPEDKAALAQKIEEMVEMYQNLLFEAVQVNPGLIYDPRIKEANDAVGSFAHAVKLMAAKEIPTSMAAAQQISADVTQMPEEWKDSLHNQTIDRLVASMEGGLEQAVSDLEMAEQQAQEQEDEVAQEMAEAAVLHSEYARRKRKRKRKCRSGAGASKMLKTHLALTADDYVLKQGRFAETGHHAHHPERHPSQPAQQSAPMGLKPEDLALIQQLGGNLRNIGHQAQNLPVQQVQADDHIAPDDKTIAQRLTEEQQRNAQRLRDRF